MSALNPNTIDLIATHPESDVVKLVIADHLDWSDVEEHCRALQDKLNSYLAFIESGDWARLEAPKLPASPQIRVLVALKYEPPVAGIQFLERARAFLKDVGVPLDVEVSNVNIPMEPN